MSAKSISKKMKQKGLHKLKFYCQMCEKQCRDENGYKCHQTSESHLRQMSLFRENPDEYMEKYSADFEEAFLAVLTRRCSGGVSVKANNVYQEIVAHRGHIHMNSTKWPTLSRFVQYLGKAGKARVEKPVGSTMPGDWDVSAINLNESKYKREELQKMQSEQLLLSEKRLAKQQHKQMEHSKKILEKQLAGQKAKSAAALAAAEVANGGKPVVVSAGFKMKSKGKKRKRAAISLGGGVGFSSSSSGSSSSGSKRSAPTEKKQAK